MILVGVAFVVLLVLNAPIAFTIGISASLFLLQEPNLPFAVAVGRMVAGTQSFPLLAVPFFVLAGHLMNGSGMTTRLLAFADALTGHLVGGIAQVSVLLSLLMGGVSGSSNADIAMETRILMPKMRAKGYADGFSTAVLAYGSLAVAIIPPSIGLILFGFVGQVSIGRLFVAGIVPGALMGAVTMVAVYLIAKRRGYDAQASRTPQPFRVVARTFVDSFWALLFPLLLVMTIRFGVFTPSEAGAFAVVYALFVGRFVYRELSWAKVREAFRAAVGDNAVILLIISMAAVLGYVFAYGRVPQGIAQLVLGLSTEPTTVLVIVLLFLLLAGTVMEGSVNILLLTPIFLPIVRQLGVDPVHFGILMSIVIQIGGVTPPVGVNMYTVCSLANVPVDKFLRESWPFLLALLILVALLVAFPQLVLFLPDLLFG
jgi:TRAP-type transport system large permease protein